MNIRGVGIFVLAAIVFSAIFLAFPLIPDGDSYFHLAVARLYAQHGIVHNLDWARFSVMANGFGDKELLFHVLLIPFATPTGGRIALALLNAAIFTAIALLGRKAAGEWGMLAAPLIYLCAGSFVARSFRLRPELLSLLLLLGATWAASRRKYVPLFFLSLAYALSYTAFQALAGLALLWMIIEKEWKPFAAVIAGLAVGLLIHPGFPANLHIWYLQNILYFRYRSGLDVGAEIYTVPTSDAFLFNLGWWLALAALLLWQRRRPAEAGPYTIFGTTAIAFAVLFLLMDRMSIYFFPFATLAVLFWIGPIQPPPRVASALLLVCVIASFPKERFIVHTLRTTGIAEADYAAMAAKIPPGARVAAAWGPAEEYAFWAPRATYLNVLDPIFMAVPHPDLYRIQRAMFAGDDADVPLTMTKVLQSDFIAFERNATTRTLEQRLRHDPRVDILHMGGNFLARIAPRRNGGFVLDWTIDATQKPYPRFPDEGYVNALRFARDDDRCVALSTARNLPVDADYELAAYGPAILAVDGETRVALQAGGSAIPGKGAVVPLRAGAHRLRVETCRGDRGQMGFYLLERITTR